MQKSRKITSRISSTSTRPVRRPSAQRGGPQLLRQQVFLAGQFIGQCTIESAQRFLEHLAVAGAGDQRRFAAGQVGLCVTPQTIQQPVETFA